MDRLSTARIGLAALLIVAAFFVFPMSRAAAGPSNACKETDYRDPSGVEYRVLFAKNGTVQQYMLVTSSHNTELDHDVRTKLEHQYGEEAADAPPLRIISFRKGDGAMMVPDKAVDSCGRVTRFH